ENCRLYETTAIPVSFEKQHKLKYNVYAVAALEWLNITEADIAAVNSNRPPNTPQLSNVEFDVWLWCPLSLASALLWLASLVSPLLVSVSSLNVEDWVQLVFTHASALLGFCGASITHSPLSPPSEG